MTDTPETCKAVGDLLVGGKRVGWLRCTEPMFHDRPDANPRRCNCGCYGSILKPTPHRAVLEWADDPVELDAWPEAYDPEETFDVEVEELDEGTIVNADLAAGRLGHPEPAPHDARTRPGNRCQARYPDGDRCIAMAGHDFGHVTASGARWEDGPTGGIRTLASPGEAWEPPYSLFGR